MTSDDLFPNLHAGTAADLGGLLDVEAGLRDVLIAAQHTRTGQDLDLNVEAGLRGVVPTLDTPPPHPGDAAAQGPRWTGLAPQQPPLAGAVATQLVSMGSTDRLALRNHPAVVALDLSLTIASAKAIALALGLALPLAFVRDLVRDLDRDLTHAHDLALDLGRDHDLDRDLVRVLAHAHDFVRTHDFDRARTLDLDRAHDRALDRDLPLAHVLARDLVRDLARDLTLAHDRGLDLAHALAFDLTYTLDLDLAHDRARHLDRARHDFTEADLSRVDLDGVSLVGVRWSTSGTQWPSEEWRAQALLDSRELDDGTYEIRGGTTKVPTHSA